MELNDIQFILPVTVITRTDISQLMRELDAIEDFFMQLKVRPPGSSINLPRTTKKMEDILGYNKLNVLQADDRAKLKLILQTIRTKEPMVHLSFSSDPSLVFLEKIITWLRQEIHPLLIIQVGLQPNIGAGFTLRTVNHFYDFSLRQHLENQNKLFIEELTRGLTL